jgi:hypothetical protein
MLTQFIRTKKHTINISFTKWFWEKIDFSINSIYIGKYKYNINNIEKLIEDLYKEINNLNGYYVKIYVSTNIYVKTSYIINCIIICDNNNLRNQNFKEEDRFFSKFEIYEITEEMLKNNKNYIQIIDYYLSWNNFYKTLTLIKQFDNTIINL